MNPLLPKTANKIKTLFNGFKGKINPSEILFPKIEDEQVQAQIDKLNKSKVQQVQQVAVDAPEKPQIPVFKSQIEYDDFSKLDIRTGKILEAEKVPKADKLLKLLVDIGLEKRTIVSGIAEHFTPEEVIGKEVSVLVNLAPRKLRGIESNGMILMAEDTNGKLYFVQANSVPPGNVIK
jgi:methionyl-tRNA synthetase